MIVCLWGVLGATGNAFAQARYSVSRVAAPKPMIVLHDETGGVEAALAPTEGGELTSLRVRFKGEWVELIYRAREYNEGGGFRGKASFLWPAVGGQYPAAVTPRSSCEEGSYRIGESSYPMPCHGFAKSLAWEEVARSADARGARVSIEIRDTAETRVMYPFAFRLRATYELADGWLAIRYVVAAGERNPAPMPFSIGNHIALRVPYLAGTDPAAMLFETNSTAQLVRDPRGLVTTERRARSFASPVPLGSFDATVALPMTGYQGDAYARLTDPQGLGLRITQRASSTLPEPVVRFNLFGAPKQGYFSPEPWFGVQNSLNHRSGLLTLPAGGTWDWAVELRPEIASGNKGR
jgi:galactose mutarotase-like enzyme